MTVFSVASGSSGFLPRVTVTLVWPLDVCHRHVAVDPGLGLDVLRELERFPQIATTDRRDGKEDRREWREREGHGEESPPERGEERAHRLLLQNALVRWNGVRARAGTEVLRSKASARYGVARPRGAVTRAHLHPTPWHRCHAVRAPTRPFRPFWRTTAEFREDVGSRKLARLLLEGRISAGSLVLPFGPAARRAGRPLLSFLSR